MALSVGHVAVTLIAGRRTDFQQVKLQLSINVSAENNRGEVQRNISHDKHTTINSIVRRHCLVESVTTTSIWGTVGLGLR